MAVRVIRGNEVLSEAFESTSKSNLLLEWWKGDSKSMKNIATKFVNEFIEYKGKSFSQSGTTYYSFIKYLEDFIKSGKKEDIYVSTSEYHGHEITINFVVTTEPQESNGKTRKENGSPIITVFLQKHNFLPAVMNIHRPSSSIEILRRILSNTRQTITHELTHFFQFKKGKLVVSDVFNNEKDVSFYLEPFYFFRYFIQEHELEAFIKSVYDLYDENKKSGKDFFSALIYQIAKRAGATYLGSNFLDGKVSFQDVLVHMQQHIQFITGWLICCYIPRYNNFVGLLKRSKMSKEDISKFTPSVLEENKKNLENFLSRLNDETEKKFDALLQKDREFSYYNALFRIKQAIKRQLKTSQIFSVKILRKAIKKLSSWNWDVF